MKKIVIFREQILGTSETFILKQIQFIKKFYVSLVGLSNAHKLDLSNLEHWCLNEHSKFQITLYKVFGICPRLVSFLKKLEPSLIHIHTGGDAARFIKVRRKLKVPVIATFHGTDASASDAWRKKQNSFYYKHYLKNRKELIKTFDCFIAISKFIKEKMIEQGFPKEKIIVHYIGVDTDSFYPQTCTKKQLILFVGRLTKQKGCEYLIKAMYEVKHEVLNAELVIIGDGPERKNLEALANELNTSCSFLGSRNEDTIKHFLSEAKVFCCPSFSEGLGIVFLEAQAMGVPVVSFMSGGIPEAVINNKTGFLYPEKDFIGLSHGIMKFLIDEQTWSLYSKNCVKHIEENFDIKKQTLQLEKIYQDVIKQYKEKQTIRLEKAYRDTLNKVRKRTLF
jgi:glycosyltransferase involved in cell wall biosynthesis